VVAKREDNLRVLEEHSAIMECEASDASMARDRAKAELAAMSEEFKGMQVSQLFKKATQPCKLSMRNSKRNTPFSRRS
jgi:hypothetical protein